MSDIMDRHAKKGTKIVFANPTFGYQSQQEHARSVLTVGSEYTVDHTVVEDDNTRVCLEEFPDLRFNSVLFRNA